MLIIPLVVMKKVLVLLLCLAFVGCKDKKEEKTLHTRVFPSVSVPGMITDPLERLKYMTSHYWDAFFEGEGTSDADYILGVKNEEIEQKVSSFIYLLSGLSVPEAQKQIASFFSQIEKKQQQDTSSLQYLRMTEVVSRYLYDPNSPMRSEDLFLPFVEGMISSEFTQEQKLAGYKFEAQMCRLNPYGAVAANFNFTDINGKRHTLHNTLAEYTVLFFSNPGCYSCQSIIEEIQAFKPIDNLIADNKLAIINIYIDGDVEEWKSYAQNYPDNWINGYDHDQIINTDQLYYVRAIPSLYLLDKQKRVIFKDAPTQTVLNFLANNLN